MSNLTKRFRRHGSAEEVLAVDDVSLQVSSGELVVLLGPSGCGKTTLLRCIAGLERPDLGQITVGGQLVYSSQAQVNVEVNRRDLSIIFQGYALWPHMTVRKNVAYPLQSRGIKSPAAIDERVTRQLEMVSLGHLEREYPGTLSGGQQQRVSLARALIAQPSVLLFDEPLSNVDAQVRTQLRSEIRQMHERVGFAALYVTHDQTEALSLGNRIAVLDGGRVVQLGTPEEVYLNPVNRYVARFVGQANTIAGRIVGGEGAVLVLDSAIGPIEATKAGQPEDLEEGFAIIRPEDVRLVPPGTPEALSAKVVACEFQGSYYDVSIGLGAGPVLRAHVARGSRPPVSGETVGIVLAPEAVKLVRD